MKYIPLNFQIFNFLQYLQNLLFFIFAFKHKIFSNNFLFINLFKFNN